MPNSGLCRVALVADRCSSGIRCRHHSGKLLAYVFVKTDLPKDENLKLPFMIQPVPIPATQTVPPLTAAPEFVPSVALTAVPAETSTLLCPLSAGLPRYLPGNC